MQKILVIKLGALGDFVLELGGMMEVHRRFPDAELTLMTNKAFLAIARQTGIFSNYIIDNRVSWFNIKEQVRLVKEVTGGGFDYIFDFQCVSRTEKKYFPVFRWFMPHSFTWVAARKGWAWRVEKSSGRGFGKLSKSDYPFNMPVTDLSFLHGENKHFDELPERFVLFIPGCSPQHLYKRWPVDNYAEIARRLGERGISTVIMGTNAEAAEANAIAAACPTVVSMLNKTSLLDIPDLSLRALAVVGNDTGPSHMASLAGSNTIVILENRNAKSVTRGPKSVNLVSPGATELITADMVWEKLLPMLDK